MTVIPRPEQRPHDVGGTEQLCGRQLQPSNKPAPNRAARTSSPALVLGLGCLSCSVLVPVCLWSAAEVVWPVHWPHMLQQAGSGCPQCPTSSKSRTPCTCSLGLRFLLFCF